MTLRSAPPLVISVPGLSLYQNALLSQFEDFFTCGSVTSRVGDNIREAVHKYVFPDESEDKNSEEQEEEEEEEEGERDVNDEEKKEEGDDDNNDEKRRKKMHKTDHGGAQHNYGLFLQFANVIDSLVTEFVDGVDKSKLPAKNPAGAAATKNGGDSEDEKKEAADGKNEQESEGGDLLTDVAEICDLLVDSPGAAMFVSIPYVAAALDFDRFQDLIYDYKDMQDCSNVGGGDDEGDNSEEGDNNDENESIPK